MIDIKIEIVIDEIRHIKTYRISDREQLISGAPLETWKDIVKYKSNTIIEDILKTIK